MRVLRLLEAPNALVHVPAEGADDSDVVVVGHLSVGDDIETGFFLVADDDLRCVVISLFVRDLLECDTNVAPKQLMTIPVGSWI